MLRHIFVVSKRKDGSNPIMAFTDANEARDFATHLLRDTYSIDEPVDLITDIQLTEGSAIDEMLRILERKLDREGIEITGVEFEDE